MKVVHTLCVFVLSNGEPASIPFSFEKCPFYIHDTLTIVVV
jgi:hypothetical protein